uniref:Uncharacterized protein n=1 Tax=Glossina palpalis gambiensis TaxID=67801 RepID=A0A1B0C0B8_9MUSC
LKWTRSDRSKIKLNKFQPTENIDVKVNTQTFYQPIESFAEATGGRRRHRNIKVCTFVCPTILKQIPYLRHTLKHKRFCGMHIVFPKHRLTFVGTCTSSSSSSSSSAAIQIVFGTLFIGIDAIVVTAVVSTGSDSSSSTFKGGMTLCLSLAFIAVVVNVQLFAFVTLEALLILLLLILLLLLLVAVPMSSWILNDPNFPLAVGKRKVLWLKKIVFFRHPRIRALFASAATILSGLPLESRSSLYGLSITRFKSSCKASKNHSSNSWESCCPPPANWGACLVTQNRNFRGATDLVVALQTSFNSSP